MLTDEQLQQAAQEDRFKSMTVTLQSVYGDEKTVDYILWIIKSDTARKYHTQEWIPVTERMPDTISILAFTGGLILTLTFIDGVYYSPDGTTWRDPVTHWMPRPEPPKQ